MFHYFLAIHVFETTFNHVTGQDFRCYPTYVPTQRFLEKNNMETDQGSTNCLVYCQKAKKKLTLYPSDFRELSHDK